MEKMMSEKKMELLSFINEKENLKQQLTAKDNELNRYFFRKLEIKIKELEDDNEDKHIIRKYAWLNELIKWNMNPITSNIIFEYLLI